MSTQLVVGRLTTKIEPGSGSGQLIFSFGSLRMTEFAVEPAMDPSGKDWECARVTLGISGIVNRVSVATNKTDTASVGVAGSGDDMAWTLRNIRDWLMLPRQYYKLTIGNQVVLETPAHIITGEILASDIRGGPYPQHGSFTPLIGAKSAILHLRLITYQAYRNKMALMSNRWSQTAQMGRDGLSTRTTTGRAVFRKDLLDIQATPLVADDFRKWLIVPGSEGTRRSNASVQQNEDGSVVDYTVTDEEVVFALGATNSVIEVTGSATASASFDIHDIKDGIKRLGSAAKAAVSADIGKFIGLTLGTAVASSKNIVSARAIGRKDCPRNKLILTAAAFCFDRLAPVISAMTIVSCTVTVNHDTDHAPFAEVRLEVLGQSLSILRSITKVDEIKGMLNLDNTIDTTSAGSGKIGPTGLGPQLPASSGTRGTWTGRLLAQLLTIPEDAYLTIDSPPADERSRDTTGII